MPAVTRSRSQRSSSERFDERESSFIDLTSAQDGSKSGENSDAGSDVILMEEVPQLGAEVEAPTDGSRSTASPDVVLVDSTDENSAVGSSRTIQSVSRRSTTFYPLFKSVRQRRLEAERRKARTEQERQRRLQARQARELAAREGVWHVESRAPAEIQVAELKNAIPSERSGSSDGDSARGGEQSTSMRSSSPAKQVSCPICLDTLSQISASNRKLQSTKCGHVFCNDCLTKALGMRNECPNCRNALRGKHVAHDLFFSLN